MESVVQALAFYGSGRTCRAWKYSSPAALYTLEMFVNSASVPKPGPPVTGTDGAGVLCGKPSAPSGFDDTVDALVGTSATAMSAVSGESAPATAALGVAAVGAKLSKRRRPATAGAAALLAVDVLLAVAVVLFVAAGAATGAVATAAADGAVAPPPAADAAAAAAPPDAGDEGSGTVTVGAVGGGGGAPAATGAAAAPPVGVAVVDASTLLAPTNPLRGAKCAQPVFLSTSMPVNWSVSGVMME